MVKNWVVGEHPGLLTPRALKYYLSEILHIKKRNLMYTYLFIYYLICI